MRRRSGKLKRPIMEFLKGGEPWTTGEIAEAVGRSVGGINSALRSLEAEGVVENRVRGVWRDATPRNLEALKADPPPEHGLEDRYGAVYMGGLLTAHYKWLAQYTGPEDDPVAVEMVLAYEHVKRAIEFRDGELVMLPTGLQAEKAGCDEGLRPPYKTVKI